jgi:hypothetical protein
MAILHSASEMFGHKFDVFRELIGLVESGAVEDDILELGTSSLELGDLGGRTWLVLGGTITTLPSSSTSAVPTAGVGAAPTGAT